MATITKTIGTSSRDYSTPILWEADLDDDDIYESNDTAIGQIYNDSVFDFAGTYLYINGGWRPGGSSLTSITLTVPEDERHDGTAGTGARIVSSSAHNRVYMRPAVSTENWLTVEWLEVDNNGRDTITVNSSGTSGCVPVIRNCLVHNGMRSLLQAISRDCRAMNNFFFAGGAVDNGTVRGVDIDADQAFGGFVNNTIFGINNNASNAAYGLYIRSDDSDGFIKNNIVMGTASTGGGSPVDIRFRSGSSIDSEYNMSSDGSADNRGSNNLIDKTSGDQFVSTVVGSEDLHLKTGADAIGAGLDLGTSPAGVQQDINNLDRDAEGVVWDMGAHQTLVATTATPAALNTYQQMRNNN
jgi:hypothetical protein